MDRRFTLLILSQHHPVSQQFQIVSFEDDASLDADVAGLMQTAEQQASQYVMNNINACAAEAVQH